MDYGLDYEGDMGGSAATTPSASRGGRGGGGGTQTQSGGNRKRASQDEQTIRSVTICMMLESQPQQIMETGMQLADGRNLHHVQFIAAVRSFDDHSTHVFYKMEDGSGGVIDVKQWLQETDECTAVTELRRLCSREHVYLKVVGKLTDYDGSKMVLADSIRPLTTANQLTHHFLQVVYQSEQHKKEELGGVMGSSGGGISAGFAGTPVMSRGAPLAQGGGGGDQLQQAVLSAFSEGANGNTIAKVVQSLQGRYPADAIKNTIEFLSAEGRLYSTIDEEHFGVV